MCCLSCSTGFDIILYVLRHTYITNLLLAGVDIKTVQYLAGHERAKITLDIYAHLTYNRPKEILEKVNAAFGEVWNYWRNMIKYSISRKFNTSEVLYV